MERKKHFGQPLPLAYFLCAYGMSLVLTGMFLAVFYFTGHLMKYLGLFVFLGVLFPFARIPFDLLIGFKLMDNIRQSESISYLDYKFQFLFSILLYVLSIFLGPFGLCYQMITLIYGAIKKNNSSN